MSIKFLLEFYIYALTLLNAKTFSSDIIKRLKNFMHEKCCYK